MTHRFKEARTWIEEAATYGLTGIAIAVLMVIVPPWLYVDTVMPNARSAGYHLLFSRPPVKTYEEMFGFVPDERMPTQYVRVA